MECEMLSQIEQLLANEVKQLHEHSNTLATDLKKRETEIMQLHYKKDHDDMSIKAQIAELKQTLNKQSETLEKISIKLLDIEKIWEANINVLIVLQAENVANQASMREILEAKQRQNELQNDRMIDEVQDEIINQAVQKEKEKAELQERLMDQIFQELDNASIIQIKIL
ncbi:MAG: hypothetical protein EZS28_027907 [Streblomastix strix]|uniref:Uncharacterized protein n=1 Tax=Streblomastix strix TaxID=222440 RepID=A0A5J4V3F7_9EUKA|nr:MAG: hypothetical protein EZS28_027907 [Streblomastix strix]